MTQVRVAFPASILLLTLSIPAVGQTLQGTRSMVMAPGVAQIPSPQDPVIVVHPELTDEQMGDLYMVRKQYREAAGMFKKLSDQDPRNPVYLNKLGIALHQQEALGLALKYYERAVKVDPRYADAENNVGTIWYQRKKYEKAIKAYQKAITMRTDMAVLYSNLGYAYFGDKKIRGSNFRFPARVGARSTSFRAQWISQRIDSAGPLRRRSRTILLHAGEVLRAGRGPRPLHPLPSQGEG